MHAHMNTGHCHQEEGQAKEGKGLPLRQRQRLKTWQLTLVHLAHRRLTVSYCPEFLNRKERREREEVKRKERRKKIFLVLQEGGQAAPYSD